MNYKVMWPLFVLVFSLQTQAKISDADSKEFFKSFAVLQQLIQLYRHDQPVKPFLDLGTNKDPEPVPAEVVEQAKKLQALTNQENCKFVMPDEETLSLGEGDMEQSVTNLSIEMSGPGCPLYLKINILAKKTDNIVDGDFNWEYKALSDEFKALSDITEIYQGGKIYVEVQPGQTSQKMILKLKITGKGVSQKLGAFNVEHAMDTDFSFNFPLDIKATNTVAHVFQLQQENIQLKRDSKIEGLFNISEKYYSNGQEVDLAAYSNLAQGIKFIGVGEKGDASKLPPLNCQLTAVDKVTGAFVANVSSCNKDAMATGFAKQEFYQVSLEYTENWVEAKLLQLSTDQSVALTALYEEESDFKKDFGALQMQLVCKPVPKCP